MFSSPLVLIMSFLAFRVMCCVHLSRLFSCFKFGAVFSCLSHIDIFGVQACGFVECHLGPVSPILSHYYNQDVCLGRNIYLCFADSKN